MSSLKALRQIVDVESSISDNELSEIVNKVIPYFDREMYNYGGNFILTDDLATRDEHLTNLCCGVIYEDYKLSTGRMLYFAFDYGH